MGREIGKRRREGTAKLSHNARSISDVVLLLCICLRDNRWFGIQKELKFLYRIRIGTMAACLLS
jgi:hypothetical protein